jgi:polysaccharide export outer membrane protein
MGSTNQVREIAGAFMTGTATKTGAHMKKRSQLKALLFTGFFTFAPAVAWSQGAPKTAARPAQAAINQAGYRIGPGDVLQITVFKEPDASVPEATVRSDGKISMPFLGEVEAQGLGPAELEKALAVKLVRFIKEPEVSVLVKSVQSEKIYVIGAVKKGGPIRLAGSMKVLEALSEAGLDDFAKTNKIYVLRNQEKIPFKYKDVIQGKHPEQNIVLQAGDTVVVP